MQAFMEVAEVRAKLVGDTVKWMEVYRGVKIVFTFVLCWKNAEWIGVPDLLIEY
jgi:hypothetical protein